MAQFVVRNLEQSVKARLKRRAARRGRSMEEEVRQILREAAKAEARPSGGLGSRIAGRFRDIGLADDLPELRGSRARSARFAR